MTGVHEAAAYRQPSDDARDGNDQKLPKIPSRHMGAIRVIDVIGIAIAVALPNVVLIAAFSAMGVGLEVFDKVAPTRASLLGDACMTSAAVMCMVLYVLSWTDWSYKAARFSALVVPWCVACGGSVLKGRKYPWGPMLMTVVHVAVLLGILRKTLCRRCMRSQFYVAVFCMTLLSAIVLAAIWSLWLRDGHIYNEDLRAEWAAAHGEIYRMIWDGRPLSYQEDCGIRRNLRGYSSEEVVKIKMACSKSNTVHFLVWACPAIGFFCNMAIAAFALLTCLTLEGPDTSRSRRAAGDAPPQAASDDLQHAGTARTEAALKRFVMLLTLLLMGMYGSVSFAGTSIRIGSTLMAFFAAAIALLICWLLVEMKGQALQTVQESKFAEMLRKLQSSDWARAMLVGGCNVTIPLFFLLDWLRQRLRPCCSALTKNKPNGPSTTFTELGERLWRHLVEWNWPRIWSKICLLGELFFMFQVGVAKATYVFLSWLNEQLSSMDYYVVIMVIFAIGYLMFLLPPVPGVPVYVFCGVVVAEQGRQIDNVGTRGGCIIAIGLAFSLKLCACCGQYYIGYFMGKSVKIQQLIGVDKVPTRAIEQILKAKGLTVGKVSVLVGGPDWPVSVTCGILKLSVLEMLIGTAPVILVLTPCVLAGAFMARVTPGQESIWNVLANAFLGLSVVGQMGSMCMAVYCITKVIDRDAANLAVHRQEHEAVERMTAREAQYVRAYKEVSEWGQLHWLRKVTGGTAAALMLLSGFVFAFMDESLFENFNISSDIQAGLEENGLGGNVLNLIKWRGYVALGMFSAAVLLHFVFVKDMEWCARDHLPNMPPLLAEEGSPAPGVVGRPMG